MRDVHCHILPGVDDGARSMDESLLMLSAAMDVGVTSIVCTPHCRDPWFDFDAMWEAFHALEARAEALPRAPKLQMAFEVNYRKLMELGLDAASRLGNLETGEFLLELPTGALPSDWERVVFALQGMDYRVTIAHPERYCSVQKDLSVARRFVEAGCALQLSANCIAGGRFDKTRRTAVTLVKEGLVTCIASDAHRPEDYASLAEARRRFGMRGSHARI